MDNESNTIYEVEPAVKFVGRVSILVDADSKEEAIARAERAILNKENGVHEKAFNRLRNDEVNSGPRGKLEGDSYVFDYGPEEDMPTRHEVLEAADDELAREAERATNEFTIIGYDTEKSARIRMVVHGDTPEKAIREFFRTFCEENYAPAVTFDFDQSLGKLEEAMDVMIVSCHEGNSNERVQEAIAYA